MRTWREHGGAGCETRACSTRPGWCSTSANSKMVRLHGRCARGERLVDHVPQGHWKTITFVAALRQHGMRASQTIDGAMTGKKFSAYVEQCLAPTLKR